MIEQPACCRNTHFYPWYLHFCHFDQREKSSASRRYTHRRSLTIVRDDKVTL